MKYCWANLVLYYIVDMCHGDRRGRKKERIRRQRKLRTGRRKKIEKGNEDGR